MIRLGLFTQRSNTIARAWTPSTDADGTKHGRVQFNTVYLMDFTDEQIAGTVIHEIGHTLGIGFEDWLPLFNHDNGDFFDAAKEALPLLHAMEVERDGGPGTRLSHWDEDLFNKELMTGYQERDGGEHVLPVTIQVMRLLGHDINDPTLEVQRALEELIEEVAGLVFSRQDEVGILNMDFVDENTEIFEEIPHGLLDDDEGLVEG